MLWFVLTAQAGPDPDPAVLRAHCDSGDMAACRYLGVENRDRALLERACAGGEGLGCASLASLLAVEDGARAMEMAMRSCTLGVSTGCSYAGGLVLSGLVEGSVADALVLASRGCFEAGTEFQGSDCVLTADMILYVGWAEGQEALAHRMLKRACKLGETRGCARIKAKPIELHQLVCDDGTAIACGLLGDAQKAAGDAEAAAAAWSKGCTPTIADGRSCGQLGWARMTGYGTAVDTDGARGVLQRSCDLGFAAACSNLGVLLFEIDRDAALRALDQSCTLGLEAGCASAVQARQMP